MGVVKKNKLTVNSNKNSTGPGAGIASTVKPLSTSTAAPNGWYNSGGNSVLGRLSSAVKQSGANGTQSYGLLGNALSKAKTKLSPYVVNKWDVDDYGDMSKYDAVGPNAGELSPYGVKDENGNIYSSGSTISRGKKSGWSYDGFDYDGPSWQDLHAPELEPFEYTGQKWSDIAKPEREKFEYDKFEVPEFNQSELTLKYRNQMEDTENGRPNPYKSQYEGAIQTILDGILNGSQQPWDATKDANYNLLYNQAREQAMTAGQKAMRDTMGTMQGMTGGYGSTAAAAAAGQAYDNSIQQLNAQNPQLMQLAYDMYRSGLNDKYQQMNTLRGLDNTAYGRWSDDYNRWADDRAYNAQQYQNMYNNDWQQYQYGTNLGYDIYSNDRNQAWNEYLNNQNMNWTEYQDAADRAWAAERAARSDYDTDTDRAYNRYADERNMRYQAERDARSDYNTDRSFDYGQYRDTVADQQWKDTFDYQKGRDTVADQRYQEETAYNRAQAAEDRDYTRARQADSDTEAAWKAAYQYVSQGLPIPSIYANKLDAATLAELQGLAAQFAAEAGGSGGGGGGRGRGGSGGSSSGDTTIRTGAPYQSGLGYFDQEEQVADLARGASSPQMADSIINYAAKTGTIQPEFAAELSDYVNSDDANTNWNRPKTIMETLIPGYISTPAKATKESSDYYKKSQKSDKKKKSGSK